MKDSYKVNHIIAKAIICTTVLLLGVIGIETGSTYASLIPGTITWFFGVNPTGWIIEAVRGQVHQHQIF